MRSLRLNSFSVPIDSESHYDWKQLIRAESIGLAPQMNRRLSGISRCTRNRRMTADVLSTLRFFSGPTDRVESEFLKLTSNAQLFAFSTCSRLYVRRFMHRPGSRVSATASSVGVLWTPDAFHSVVSRPVDSVRRLSTCSSKISADCGS